MNLRSIDLNLLVVLDALLDEAHVSRAAIRLGLSQPATSQALDRCRHLFADALLETPLRWDAAHAQGRGVAGAVEDRFSPGASALMAPPEFDLATVDRRGPASPWPIIRRSRSSVPCNRGWPRARRALIW